MVCVTDKGPAERRTLYASASLWGQKLTDKVRRSADPLPVTVYGKHALMHQLNTAQQQETRSEFDCLPACNRATSQEQVPSCSATVQCNSAT
eukprot:1161401-Pelagomonas_calceolata.AAC.9